MPREKALVIGSTGFIGQAVCQGLSDEGYEVRECSRTSSDIQLDVTGKVDFEKLPEAEIVVYAAGVGHLVDLEGKEEYSRVLEFLDGLGDRYPESKMVFFSSLAAMGLRNDYSLDSRPEPVLPFSRFKLRCEEKVREKFDDHLILRPGFVYDEETTHELLEKASVGSFAAYVDSTTVAIHQDNLVDKTVELVKEGGEGVFLLGEEIEIRELAERTGMVPALKLPASLIIAAGLSGSVLRSFGLEVPGLEMAKSVLEEDEIDAG